MSNNQPTHHLDRPIESRSEDKLERAAFVKSLGKRLVVNGKATGLIVGVEGEWGSGKSSILNMLKEELGLRKEYGAPLVMRFDPWLISTRDDLIAHFFAQLTSELRQYVGHYDVYDSGRDQLTDKVVNLIAEYGEGISPAFNKIIPVSGTGLKIFSKFIAGKKEFRASLPQLRLEVASGLKKLDFPIVILIDELDRLEDGEVRTMAQLLRSVADFPSVSYAISYDEKRVVEALGGGSDELSRDRGQAYLEKIVQINVRVPPIEKSEIVNILRRDLGDVLRFSNIPLTPEDKKRFEEIFSIVVPAAIKNTRDIQKVVSDFSGRVVGLEGEVNPVDAFALSIFNVKEQKQIRHLSSAVTTEMQNIAPRNCATAFRMMDFSDSTFLPYHRATTQFDSQWAKKLANFIFPQEERKLKIDEIYSDRLTSLIAIRKSVKQDSKIGVPTRSQFRRLTSLLNKGEFEKTERFSKIRDQIKFLDYIDEFHAEFDEVGFPRFISYLGYRIEQILEGDSSAQINSFKILAAAGLINRISRRSEFLGLDLQGVIARMISGGAIHLGAALLCDEFFLRQAWKNHEGLAKTSLSPKAIQNLRGLLSRFLSGPHGVPRRGVILAAFPQTNSDINISRPALDVLDNSRDHEFAIDCMSFLFSRPFDEVDYSASAEHISQRYLRPDEFQYFVSNIYPEMNARSPELLSQHLDAVRLLVTKMRF